MAIVKMKKAVIAAPQYRRDSVLDTLQSSGIVQLIDIKDDDLDTYDLETFKVSNSLAHAEVDYNNIKFTYEFLKRFIKKKKGLFEKKEIISENGFRFLERQINWQSIYERCRSIDNSINLNINKRTKVNSLIELYSEWSNLDICNNDLSCLNKVSYFIGSIDKKVETSLYQEFDKIGSGSYIEQISEKKQGINIFILCHIDDSPEVSEALKKYGFIKAGIDLSILPDKQISELNSQAVLLDEEYNKLVEEANTLTENIKDIEKVYDYMACMLEKESSMSKLVKTKKTFVLEGWVPENEELKLRGVLENKYDDICIVFEEPAEDEIPPIKLNNNKLVEPFEMITSMYALPQYTEIDPTPILTPFYMLFFGMMAGDIGYGLVMLIASVVALKFMDIEGDARKLMKIILYCSFPTIIFGWLFGGFFGNAVPLTPGWVNPVDNPMAVLYVSLGLGIVHLFTGLGVKAYWLIKNGKVLDAIFDVFFWYVLLIGLIWLLLSGMVGLPGASVSKYVAMAGAIGLLLTQGRGNATIVGKFFGGVYGLYGVTSYIGDVLSYSRLLALGLATGLIGSSFNLLIKLLPSGVVAIMGGAIIFIFGHTFNFLIGMLGTFVHTCRLEYLEFFGKFYEGGGSAFKPFSIKTKFIKVRSES